MQLCRLTPRSKAKIRLPVHSAWLLREGLEQVGAAA
jgi:hypothetical protein